ncbi:DUF4328 domain-containing protein [Nonomuraea sp. SBT364]|uniref:DUF4328 domain-containing protein n=1 Tax=Nonomuraea sp. SBT364 TaxID=1580530 RepID=UPI00066DDB85|nr:DUF4328 domain-containing protein [Nonomuraea sp. SBT364]
MLVTFSYVDTVDRLITDRDSVSGTEIEGLNRMLAVTGVLDTLISLTAMVTFLIWLFRVRKNAEILAPTGHRLIRPWLFLGWVIPVIALWFPKRIVDDIWYASARATHPARPPKLLINLWWAAWLTAVLVTYGARRLLVSADEHDLESLMDSASFDVLGILLYWVAAALAIGVIHRITKAQHRHRTPR